jgi:hypothetical protein
MPNSLCYWDLLELNATTTTRMTLIFTFIASSSTYLLIQTKRDANKLTR